MLFIKIKQEILQFYEYFNHESFIYIFMSRGDEFNSVILFTVLYSRFQHCAEDMSKVTAQHTTLEYPTKTKLSLHIA